MGEVALQSDFRDYYDHWFATKSDIVFERYTRAKTTRQADFSLLQEMGLVTPTCGTVSELWQTLCTQMPEVNQRELANVFQVVVYVDPYAHAGEGKLLCTYEQALEEYTNAFASEYIPANVNGFGTSFRYLRVGLRQFWLRYTSQDDWRSNAGEVAIKLICEEAPAEKCGKAPLYAIDFIYVSSRFIALDYNPAPCIKGTGIEDAVQGLDVYKQLVAYYKD